MKFLVLGSLLSVVGYAVVSTLGCLLVAAGWWTWRDKIGSLSPRRRAEVVLMVRLFPVGVGALVTLGLFARAYVLYEPRDSSEAIGPVLVALALAAALLVARNPLVAWRSWRRAGVLSKSWLKAGEPLAIQGAPAPIGLIDQAFPIVTVVGVRTPRILLASSVRTACTKEELLAVIAHERAHIDHQDNWKRLLMRGAPDLLGWTQLGDAIEQAWSDASEEAADELVEEPLTLALASALVKVARLAVDASPRPATLTALYKTGSIAHRVQRLVRARPHLSRRHRSWWPWVLFGAIALVASVPTGALVQAQALTEALVAFVQ